MPLSEQLVVYWEENNKPAPKVLTVPPSVRGLPFDVSGRPRPEDKVKEVSIAALSARAAKTTTFDALNAQYAQRGATIHQVTERWQGNPYLQQKHDDPEAKSRNNLNSQRYFLTDKVSQLRIAENIPHNGGQEVILTEVSHWMDMMYGFAMVVYGTMTEEHFVLSQRLKEVLTLDQLSQPDVLVFLNASDKVVYQRIMEHKREFEDPAFFMTLAAVMRQWLADVRETDINLVEINTEELDYRDPYSADAVELYNRVDGALHREVQVARV